MNNRTSAATVLLLALIAVLLVVLVYQGGWKTAGTPALVQPPAEAQAGRSSGPKPRIPVGDGASTEPSSQVLTATTRVSREPMPALLVANTTGSEGLTALVPLALRLPTPGFPGTPKDLALSSYVEPLSDKPRPPLMVPDGLTNAAPGSNITCSDQRQPPAALAKIVDGDKEATDESILFLRKGLQWVQFDLGEDLELFAIVLWHAHDRRKVYHDVIVLAGADADFAAKPLTLYNNDQDNTSGLGVGTDKEYFETHEGRLINPRGAKARFLRFYSRGSTDSALNEYTEIEVYARRAI